VRVTVNQRSMFAGIIVLIVCGTVMAQSQVKPELSPAELIKGVLRNEQNTPDVTGVHWKYRLNKEVDGKQEIREVVESKFGSIDRLLAIDGSPLTDAQEREESARILTLSRNPEKQHQLEQAHQKDVAQCNEFFKMIPDAFLFENGGEKGNLTKLLFKPNPNFQPASREGKVLHEMAGEIWINAKEQRFVSMNGQLINEVKFGGGLLGHLEKGGHFNVRRNEIAPGHWEVTEITVNMRGKALLFKTISVQQKELHSNFQAVPEDLNLADAAGLLLKQALIATKR
jgi:hypothetical protein